MFIKFITVMVEILARFIADHYDAARCKHHHSHHVHRDYHDYHGHHDYHRHHVYHHHHGHHYLQSSGFVGSSVTQELVF